MDREKQIDKMLLMMELYFEQEKGDQVLKLYHKLWDGVPVDDLAEACRRYMSTGNKWFPRAGEILDLVRSIHQPASIESSAQHQWRLVMTAVRQRGLMRGAPVFEDPITNTVIRTQFTWEYLCNMQADKSNWEEKRFVEAYQLASEIDPDKLMIEARMPEIKKLISRIGKIDE